MIKDPLLNKDPKNVQNHWSLKNLRSVGLTDAIKDLINGGPPPGMLTRFLSIFEEKRAETEKIVHSTLLEAGW